MPSLPDIARATVAEHRMLPAGAPLLAMVSGGADSTALLRLLASGDLGTLDLAVLHVDHALRDDSSADAAWVAGLSASLGVPCRVVRYDVAAYAEADGLNLEDAGRRVRYRFADEELDARCDAAGVPASRGRIATAHTLNDRVETFLMRALSGSGASGLAGVPPVRGRVVRPLIEARRADVTGYLETLGQDWREDVTNADTSRLRARVRHEVVPALAAVEPALHETLARTLRILADEDALLGEMAEAFARDFAEVTPDGALELDRALMRTLSRPMARRAVREALAGAFPEASRIEFAHVEALVDGFADDAFARDLPGGLRAEAGPVTLVVARAPGAIAPIEPTLLEVPGAADLGAAGRITATEAPPAPVPDDADTALLDLDSLALPLVVDAPRPGDRIRPLGLGGTKKVGDLLTDEKVPERLRPATPVVRDSSGVVVWVAGVRIAEDAKVTDETTSAVALRWERRSTPRDSAGGRADRP